MRLLDDEFYKKSRPSKAAISEMAKQNARDAVSTQYEKIGDVLGDKFRMGKFEDIDDLDDLYKSVLNHISIPHLVKMSAQCLMQVLGLDELQRQFCRSTIMKYRSYQGEIIDYVASKGPAGARVAAQLGRAMETLDKGLQDGIAKSAAYGAKKIGSAISIGNQLATWQKKENLELFLVDLDEQWTAKRAQAQRQDNAADDTFISPNLDNKIVRKAKRMEALEMRIEEQKEREEMLGPDKVPANERELLGKYKAELWELTKEVEELEVASRALSTQTHAYQFLIQEFIPILTHINPFIKDGGSISAYGSHIGGTASAIAMFKNLAVDKGTTMVSFTAEDGTVTTNEVANTYYKEVLGTSILAKFNDVRKKLESLDWGALGAKKSGVQTQKQIFNQHMRPLVGLILERINELDTGAMATFQKAFVMKGGKQVAEQTLDDIFNDPDDGLLVCAAIFAIVPAALYGLYYLTSNAEEISKRIGEDAEAVAQAAERRVEMFLRTDYPVNDILEGFKEALYDLAMNLVRDLIVNGIMYTMKLLMRACDDSESANSPETPLGKIDLGEFMRSSARSGSVKRSKGFSKIHSQTALSLAQYERLLNDISAAFTINEMVSLLRGDGSNRLYSKLLGLLQSLQYLNDTQFHQDYVNEDGVHTFVSLLAKDIDPALLIGARNNFDRQKKMVLNLCGMTNEDIKKLELSKYMTPEELMKAMADADANRRHLLNQALNNVGDILAGPITPAQLCSDDDNESRASISPYHESQKFASVQAANAIFGNVENIFEAEIGRVKNIYRELYKVTVPRGMGALVPLYSANAIPGGPFDPDDEADEIGDAFEKALKDTAKIGKSGFAAPSLQRSIISLINPEDDSKKTGFFRVSPDGSRIVFDFDADMLPGKGKIGKSVRMSYSGKPFAEMSLIPGGINPNLFNMINLKAALGVATAEESQFAWLVGSDWNDEEALKWGSTIANAYEQIWEGKRALPEDKHYWVSAPPGQTGPGKYVKHVASDECRVQYDRAKTYVDAWLDPSDKAKLLKAMHQYHKPTHKELYKNWRGETKQKTVKTSLEDYMNNPLRGPTEEEEAKLKKELDTLQKKHRKAFEKCANSVASNMNLWEKITYWDWETMGTIYEEVFAWVNSGAWLVEEVDGTPEKVYSGIESPYGKSIWQGIQEMKVYKQRWEKLNAVCLYLHNNADSWLPGTPSKAEIAQKAAAEKSAKTMAEAKDQQELYFPDGKESNLLLSVTGKDRAPIYTYASEKPAIMENFQTQYVAGSFYSGAETNENLDARSKELERFVKNNDLYISALNEMFQDLLTSTARNGLFLDQPAPADAPPNPNRQIFQHLRLSKEIPRNAAGQCFLGFFNHKVLNAQVQNLTDALKCVNPGAVQKSATNLAYIKIALDCVVRAIVVKEMMKSLFIFGFTDTGDQYAQNLAKSIAGSPTTSQPFFEVYLFEEIERALKKQFKTVSGGGVDDFYTEIMEEFIRDISRVVYQDETMSTRTALDILIKDQVQYVKTQLLRGMPKALENTPGYFDRRLHQQVALPSPGSKAGATKGPTHVQLLDVIEKSDQLKVLQNEQLTLYLNTMGGPHPIDLVHPVEDKTGAAYHFEQNPVNYSSTIDFDPAPYDGAPTPNQFTLVRQHNVPLRDFMKPPALPVKNTQANQQAAKSPPPEANTTNLEDALGGVNSGFATEKFVELNYNSGFFTKMSEKQKTRLAQEFSMWESLTVGTATMRKEVRDFLNETKLILLFPQARPLLYGQPDAGLSDVYKDVADIEAHAENTKRNALFKIAKQSIFWQVFRYNFDPEFTAEKKLELMKAYPDLAWGMTGKIYVNDFEEMVSQFHYPFIPETYCPADPNVFKTHSSAERFRYIYANGFQFKNIGPLLPRVKWIETSGKYGPGADIGNAYENSPSNALSRMQILYARLRNLYGKPAGDFSKVKGDRAWWPTLDDQEQARMESLPGASEPYVHVSFFTWFLSQPVNEIMDIKYISRVSQYVSEIDRPGIQQNFDESAIGADEPSLTLWRLREKTGKVNFEDPDHTHSYVTFPVYTVQAQTPPSFQSTWFESIYKIYKKNTRGSQEVYVNPRWEDFFTKEKLESEGGTWARIVDKLDSLKDLYETKTAANGKEQPRGDVPFPWPWLFQAEYTWDQDGVAGTAGDSIIERVNKGLPYGYCDVVRKIDWPRGKQVTRWATETLSDLDVGTNSNRGRTYKLSPSHEEAHGALQLHMESETISKTQYSSTQGKHIVVQVANPDLLDWATEQAEGTGPYGYQRFTKWWYDHWEKVDSNLSNECFFEAGIGRYSHNSAAVNYESRAAKKDAIRANMKIAYLAALDQTLYGKQGATVLYEVAKDIVGYLESLERPGLSLWIAEQRDMILNFEQKTAPWYPGDDQPSDAEGLDIDRGYNFEDANWVYVKIVQDFLYQLSLNEYGEDLINNGAIPNYPNPQVTWESTNLSEKIRPGAQWRKVKWDENTEFLDASDWTLGIKDMSASDYKHAATLGDAFTDLYYRAERLAWKSDTLADLFGFQNKDGTILDVLGTARVYPYEYNAPAFDDVADIKDLLFAEGDVKKDIYTLTAKFADRRVGPEEIMGKMIEGSPCEKREVFTQLMQSFFVKEQSTILTLIFRILVEKYYPALEYNFDATTAMATETLLSAIAVANGDYQRTPDSNQAPLGGLDLGALGMGILKSFLGSMANTVDPTWKTPWPWDFGIGPLTPIGVAAKLLNGYNPNFSSVSKMRRIPSSCDDLVEDVAKEIKYGPLLIPSDTEKEPE